jgi:hypothetical protein
MKPEGTKEADGMVLTKKKPLAETQINDMGLKFWVGM